MTLTYIFAKESTPSSPVRQDKDNPSMFQADYNCIVGIEGDTHGLILNTGTTVSWSEKISYEDAIKTVIPALLQTWLDENFNS